MGNKGILREAASTSVLIPDAIDRFLDAREHFGYRPSYYKSLRQIGARLKSSFPSHTLHESASLLPDWLAQQQWSPSALVSNIGRLSSFYGYAYKRGWIAENPCDRLDLPRLHRQTPKVLTVQQCVTALRWTFRHEPSALAFLSLALFCGIRPEETGRLPNDAVYLDRREVRIDSDVSKVHSRRIVPIPENARQWLKLAQRHGAALPFCKSSRKRYLKRLRAVLEFPAWPQDILRHTAASYLLAREQDAGRVALWLGNSPRILLKHYHSLVYDAPAFWSLTPNGNALPDDVLDKARLPERIINPRCP